MNEEQILELFHKPFDKSTEIDETFAKIWADEGGKKALDYLLSVGATWIDVKSYKICYAIKECTKSATPEEKKKEWIKSLVDGKEVTSADIIYNETKKVDEITLETECGPIRAITFSDLTPKILKVLPCLDNEDRAGQCFKLAYEISKRLGIANDMVTGYIYGYTDKSKFLHTWVETTYKGEEYVIDGVFNMMINKDAYYHLKHAQVINRISNETYKQDIEENIDKLDGVKLEVYLVYRDEIINGQELTPDKLKIEEKFTHTQE